MAAGRRLDLSSPVERILETAFLSPGPPRPPALIEANPWRPDETRSTNVVAIVDTPEDAARMSELPFDRDGNHVRESRCR